MQDGRSKAEDAADVAARPRLRSEPRPRHGKGHIAVRGVAMLRSPLLHEEPSSLRVKRTYSDALSSETLGNVLRRARAGAESPQWNSSERHARAAGAFEIVPRLHPGLSSDDGDATRPSTAAHELTPLGHDDLRAAAWRIVQMHN